MIGYNLVQYRNETYSGGSPKLITLRIKQALAKLEQALGYDPESLDLAQGCHHDGALSGSTHLRADVFDISYANAVDKARAGLDLGIIVFIRDEGWDGHDGAPHCHCLLAGSEHFSEQAAAQVPDWRSHKDGLAGHSPYNPQYPWKGDISNFHYDPHWTRGGSGGGQQQRGKPDPFGTIAAQVGVGVLHSQYLHVKSLVDTVVKNHPQWTDWAADDAALLTAGQTINQVHDKIKTRNEGKG